MIPCKTSRTLPLHLAAASSASSHVVECFIAEYPEAVYIAVNNSTPKNLVTAALPMESIKLICRPNLHIYGMHPPQNAEKDEIAESRNAECLRPIAMELAKMAKIFEAFCSNLFELNVKVDAVEKQLVEHSTKPNDHIAIDISSFSVCESESPAGDSYPLGMPAATKPLIINRKRRLKE